MSGLSRIRDDQGAWVEDAWEGDSVQPREGRALAQVMSGMRGGRWAPFDALAAAVAVLMAHAVSPVFAGPLLGPSPLRVAGVYSAAFVVAAYMVGLYDWNAIVRRGTFLGRSLLAAVLSMVATLGFFYLFFYQPIGRWVIAVAGTLSAAFALIPRHLVWAMLKRQPRRVLFVGTSPLVSKTVSALQQEFSHLYEVVPRPPDGADLVDYCRTQAVDEVVLPNNAGELSALLRPVLRCLRLGCRVRSEADFYLDAFQCVPVLDVEPDWVLSGGWDTSNHLVEAAKRAGDLLLAAAALVLLLPILLLVIPVMALTEGRPIFYSQPRVGRYGRLFTILKLRTMRKDAEEAGAQWAQVDDPRRTPLGRILRRTRVDELPQLINILLGHMAFVGPRPERPEFASELERTVPYYAFRHVVRPGLTGWAQIHYPYGGNVEDARRKLEFDLYYIRHQSLMTDLAIVLRTVSAAARGAR